MSQETPSPPTLQPAHAASVIGQIIRTVCVAGCAALGVLGSVPVTDLLFAALYPAYLAVINKVRFEKNKGYTERDLEPLDYRPIKNAWTRKYALSAFVVAVLAPWLLIIAQWQNVAVRHLLAPHLFLVMVQVLCEHLFYRRDVALLVRFMVPIGFNAFRISTVCAWAKAALAGGFGVGHLALAFANVALWSFNVFTFLPFVIAPLYLNQTRCKV